MNNYVKANSASTGDCVSQKSVISTKTCSCGGAGCTNCGGESHIRPRFVAGQLLTEEDLQSLSDYVVAKNRLHNRHFFGEGVVCGLEVACHPCGDGKAIVAPGYALDCCGNDIVLSCPTELDINAMVRELRINTLDGYDCGDPCVSSMKTDCNDNSKKDFDGDDRRPPARRYSLYIRYYEEQTDPIIPYGTDEPCVNPGCEPTRIREGIRFELRCCEDDDTPDNLFTRIGHCLGDLVALERIAREGKWQRTVIADQVSADQAISESRDTNFNFSDLGWATNELSLLNGKIEGSENAVVSQKEFQDILDATLSVVRLVAGHLTDKERNNQLRPAGRDKVSSDNEQDDEITQLVTAKSAIEKAYQVVGNSINEILETTVEQVYAHALFEIGLAVANEAAYVPQYPQVQVKRPNSDKGKRSTADASNESPPIADRVARLYLAFGSVALPSLLRVQASSLEALRDWLLERIDKATWLTDCSLRQDIMAIRLQSPVQQQFLQRSDIKSIDSAGEKLLDALIRYLRQCICRAFLPPCSPCNDTAVLLACLKVRDCDVIEICNLERTFVLTPVAFRYWIPPLHWFGEFIEKLCCQPIRLYGESNDFRDYKPQSLKNQSIEKDLSDRIIEKLAESLGMVQNGDKQRLMRTASALVDLIGREQLIKISQLNTAWTRNNAGGTSS